MTLEEAKRPLSGVLFAALALNVSVWFVYQGFTGQNGAQARLLTEIQMQELNAQIVEREAELDRLENLTARLSSRSLDLELLDERARAVLGMIHVNEVLIQ